VAACISDCGLYTEYSTQYTNHNLKHMLHSTAKLMTEYSTQYTNDNLKHMRHSTAKLMTEYSTQYTNDNLKHMLPQHCKTYNWVQYSVNKPQSETHAATTLQNL
jgi:hypothetical protein